MASVSYNGRSDRWSASTPRVDIRQNRPERPRLLRCEAIGKGTGCATRCRTTFTFFCKNSPAVWPEHDPRSRPGSPAAHAEAIYRLERHAMDRDLREARRRYTLRLDALRDRMDDPDIGNASRSACPHGDALPDDTEADRFACGHPRT